MGRLSQYDPEIAADICQRISTESLSLEAICDSDERFPASRTFYRWLLDQAELRQLYARAKESQLQLLADEILPIADELPIMTVQGESANGSWSKDQVDPAGIQRNRVRIDARKWLLSKLAPKVYGDKLGLTGGDGEGPIQIVSTIPRPPKE